jgi:hypothetical protein
MKSLFIALYLFLFSPLFAQEQMIKITNYMTEKYRDYPFTKISLLLPDGFAFSLIDNGFKDQKTRSVIRIEEVGAPVDTVADKFLRRFDVTTAQDSFGFTMKEKMTARINGKHGFLVGLTAEVDGDDYDHTWLFIGDAERTYVIKSMTPYENGEQEVRRIRAAVLSVYYDPDRIMPGQDATSSGSSSCNCNDKK